MSTHIEEYREYLLGQVKFYQTPPIAVYCMSDYINSSCFSIIHKLELSSIIISETFLTNKLIFIMINQYATDILNILGLNDLTPKL